MSVQHYHAAVHLCWRSVVLYTRTSRQVVVPTIHFGIQNHSNEVLVHNDLFSYRGSLLGTSWWHKHLTHHYFCSCFFWLFRLSPPSTTLTTVPLLPYFHKISLSLPNTVKTISQLDLFVLLTNIITTLVIIPETTDPPKTYLKLKYTMTKIKVTF